MTDNQGKGFPGEKVVDRDIEDELKESYLTYSMSVIVQRALPDVRDGLKPSQRRILVAMKDLNLTPRSQHRKCAAIVGKTMMDYHPHGDSAIYPTLVRMAQKFNTRYVLVDSQGNFGSVDGDPPAAMRYTEARMAEGTMEMMADLEMDTVDYMPTFDNRLEEPAVLPARFPNLLCNGSIGIAVGMATSIPPHNVREVCSGIRAVIDNPEITVDELMEHIRGPDFPTGAFICGRSGIAQAYKTGRGLITVRSKYDLEDGKKNKTIVFTEIPYQESKLTIIERISTCVKDGRIKGISDIRDESDKRVRLVIELRSDANPEIVVNQLFKFTPLQTTFSIINIALVRGRPETLNLKEILVEYKRHRMEIIRRRTRFLLRKAEERAHIVEGLLKALDHIDAIIRLIRGSQTVDEARAGIMSQFGFTDPQARAILNMTLQRLTGLERQKLVDEMEKLQKDIKHYREILASHRLLLDIILEDLKAVEERFGDDRRTEIIEDADEMTAEDLITDQQVVVTISHEGYIKRMALTTYRKQGRGGRGITGSTAKEGDFIKDLFVASTHDYILFLTNRGRLHWLKVYECPEMSRTARGRSLVNLIQLRSNETVSNQICVHDFDGSQCLVIATRGGVIKKSNLSAFSRPKRGGIIAIELKEDDALIGASICGEGDEIILGTRNGMAIRFKESDCRAMGRAARGVGGISLRKGDSVVDMVVVNTRQAEPTLLVVCAKGMGKRTPLSAYRLQRRNGGGTINIRVTEKNGPVVALKAVTDDNDIVLMTKNGLIMRTSVADFRAIGRATQGVRLINLKEGDEFIGVEKVVRDETRAPDTGPDGSSEAPHDPGGSHGAAADGGASAEHDPPATENSRGDGEASASDGPEKSGQGD